MLLFALILLVISNPTYGEARDVPPRRIYILYGSVDGTRGVQREFLGPGFGGLTSDTPAGWVDAFRRLQARLQTVQDKGYQLEAIREVTGHEFVRAISDPEALGVVHYGHTDPMGGGSPIVYVNPRGRDRSLFSGDDLDFYVEEAGPNYRAGENLKFYYSGGCHSTLCQNEIRQGLRLPKSVELLPSDAIRAYTVNEIYNDFMGGRMSAILDALPDLTQKLTGQESFETLCRLVERAQGKYLKEIFRRMESIYRSPTFPKETILQSSDVHVQKGYLGYLLYQQTPLDEPEKAALLRMIQSGQSELSQLASAVAVRNPGVQGDTFYHAIGEAMNRAGPEGGDSRRLSFEPFWKMEPLSYYYRSFESKRSPLNQETLLALLSRLEKMKDMEFQAAFRQISSSNLQNSDSVLNKLRELGGKADFDVAMRAEQAFFNATKQPLEVFWERAPQFLKTEKPFNQWFLLQRISERKYFPMGISSSLSQLIRQGLGTVDLDRILEVLRLTKTVSPEIVDALIEHLNKSWTDTDTSPSKIGKFLSEQPELTDDQLLRVRRYAPKVYKDLAPLDRRCSLFLKASVEALLKPRKN